MTVTLCLSCSLRCSTRGLGVHSIGSFPRAPSVGCGLPYHISSLLSGSLLATASGVSEVPLGRVWPSQPHLVSNPLGVCWQLHRGFPRSPSVGCGLPNHISSLTLWESAGNCSGTQTQLSLIITQRPHDRLLDLWNRMFNRHQAEITVMQFRGYSLPVHDCNGTMGPSPFPIS